MFCCSLTLFTWNLHGLWWQHLWWSSSAAERAVSQPCCPSGCRSSSSRGAPQCGNVLRMKTWVQFIAPTSEDMILQHVTHCSSPQRPSPPDGSDPETGPRTGKPVGWREACPWWHHHLLIPSHQEAVTPPTLTSWNKKVHSVITILSIRTNKKTNKIKNQNKLVKELWRIMFHMWS